MQVLLHVCLYISVGLCIHAYLSSTGIMCKIIQFTYIYIYVYTRAYVHTHIPISFFRLYYIQNTHSIWKCFCFSSFLFSFSSSGYMAMEKQRQRLPAYKHRSSLLYLVENHATTIIMGETGSGKTTQIPQVSTKFCCLFYILYESRLTKFNIYYNYKWRKPFYNLNRIALSFSLFMI